MHIARSCNTSRVRTRRIRKSNSKQNSKAPACAVNEQLGMNATVAAARVINLATGARSEYVQLEASKDILDRAGFKPIDRSQVQVAGDIRVSIDLG